jgi:predicted amidohydrolase
MMKQGTVLLAMAALAMGVMVTDAHAKKLRVGVVQTVIEDRLEKNRAKLLRFIDEAKSSGCQLVIFPESGLHWPDIAVDDPTKAELDTAIEQIGERARAAGLWVVFGTSYRGSDGGKYQNRGAVFGPDGKRVIFYQKSSDVPQGFEVDGVPCNLLICSDRWYMEHSELPCLVQGSQVIIDISGGHGGDDGRPDLRLIRYRPWAARMGAYVIVSNPVHDDTDFMGNSPWGGGSAVIRPDGSVQAGRRYEKDVMIVEEIDTDLATRVEAERRRNHPLFRDFWEMGKRVLEGGETPSALDITPYSSAERDVKIAVAQMACSREMDENVSAMVRYIGRAAEDGADIVVFPELALTGARREDVEAASKAALDDALNRIEAEAKARGIYVIVGMPYFVDGARKNCAVVIGDDGSVLTRYAQIATSRDDLFGGGNDPGAMWFELKGVHSIVTIGHDADWVELGDLSANRGMCLRFHISYEADASEDDAILRRQRNLVALSYAMFGAAVNAGDPSGLKDPSAPASGGSLITSREGGHAQAAPEGLEYYLPYQTSVVTSASGGEAMISAARGTPRNSAFDLNRNGRNGNRKRRAQPGWHEWIRQGAALIDGNVGAGRE